MPPKATKTRNRAAERWVKGGALPFSGLGHPEQQPCQQAEGTDLLTDQDPATSRQTKEGKESGPCFGRVHKEQTTHFHLVLKSSCSRALMASLST